METTLPSAAPLQPQSPQSPSWDTWLRQIVAQTYSGMNNPAPMNLEGMAATADHINGKVANSGGGNHPSQVFDRPPMPAGQAIPGNAEAFYAMGRK